MAGVACSLSKHTEHSCCRRLAVCHVDKAFVSVQMLDADDAILEQAMQTGAALKRARDNQKAARKPKVGSY